jgi:hypothetical protein
MRRPCGTSATSRAAMSSGAYRVTARPNSSTAPERAGTSPTVTFTQVAPLRPSRPSREAASALPGGQRSKYVPTPRSTSSEFFGREAYVIQGTRYFAGG